jgi:hypothetical protein
MIAATGRAQKLCRRGRRRRVELKALDTPLHGGFAFMTFHLTPYRSS